MKERPGLSDVQRRRRVKDEGPAADGRRHAAVGDEAAVLPTVVKESHVEGRWSGSAVRFADDRTGRQHAKGEARPAFGERWNCETGHHLNKLITILVLEIDILLQKKICSQLFDLLYLKFSRLFDD